MSTWSPLQLFLYLFQPVLDLLLFHTNTVAQSSENRWKSITQLDLRRWLAVRLEMGLELKERTPMGSFWSHNHLTATYISRDRFTNIERYLSLESREQMSYNHTPWFWKIEAAITLFRRQLYQFLIPASYLVVDESTIQFFWRKQDKVVMPHKPDKEGFLLYSCASHGGAVYDFSLYSSCEQKRNLSRFSG
jgi:hypothetical protein